MKKYIKIMLVAFIILIIPFNSKADFLYNEAYRAFEYTNKERKKNGLNELEWDPEMELAAEKRAKEISIRFSHTRMNGWQFSSMYERMYGENIAYGQSTAEDVMYGHSGVKSWMHSQSHKDLILDPDVVSLGVAAYKDEEDGMIYWAGEFSNTKPTNSETISMLVSRYSDYEGYDTILKEEDVDTIQIEQYPVPAGMVQTVRKTYTLKEDNYYYDNYDEVLVDETYVEGSPEIKIIPTANRENLESSLNELKNIDTKDLENNLIDEINSNIDDSNYFMENPSYQSDINDMTDKNNELIERVNTKLDEIAKEKEKEELEKKRLSEEKRQEKIEREKKEKEQEKLQKEQKQKKQQEQQKRQKIIIIALAIAVISLMAVVIRKKR
ncbi:MAG: CAP domain-containing protein [Tissierellia bacterium]|nr:CAP domain-containing protein [Tissierellia bacterium]